jgi:hypothetical protein
MSTCQPRTNLGHVEKPIGTLARFDFSLTTTYFNLHLRAKPCKALLTAPTPSIRHSRHSFAAPAMLCQPSSCAYLHISIPLRT